MSPLRLALLTLLILLVRGVGLCASRPEGELIPRLQSALEGLEAAHEEARRTAQEVREVDARLSSAVEHLGQALPAVPPGAQTLESYDEPFLKEAFETQLAYLRELEARPDLAAEARAGFEEGARALELLPGRLEFLEEAHGACAALLGDLREEVRSGRLAFDAGAFGGASLEDLSARLAAVEAEEQTWAVELGELEASLAEARGTREAWVLPDEASLASARHESDVLELLLAVRVFAREQREEALKETPELVAAAYVQQLERWREGNSTFPAARDRALELREAFVEAEQALADLPAPRAEDWDSGSGTPELQAARRDLEYAEAFQAFLQRKLELLVEVREAARLLLEADEELGLVTKSMAEEALRLGGQYGAVLALRESGELTTELEPVDADELWRTFKSLVPREVDRRDEVARLGARLASEEELDAARAAIAAQAERVEAARLTYAEEQDYGAVVAAMAERDAESLLDDVRPSGGLQRELDASAQELAESEAAFERSVEELDGVLELLDVLESPHTQAVIERQVSRHVELRRELEALAEAPEARLPQDASSDAERLAELDEFKEGGTSLESPSALPSRAELALLNEEQVGARGRISYFEDFQSLVERMTAVSERGRERAQAVEDAQAALIELERRRYASALELEHRLEDRRLTRFSVDVDLGPFISRAAVRLAIGQREEFRGRFEDLREEVRRNLARYEAMLSWRTWAELGGELAREKLHLITLPVEHVEAARTPVEELRDYEQENLRHLAREREDAERSWSAQALSAFGGAEDNALFRATLEAHYLELVNTERVRHELAQAAEAYEDLIELSLAYRADLEAALSEENRGLEVRLADYQVARYQAAIAARPRSRVVLRSEFRSAYGHELPEARRKGDLDFWAERLLSVESRLWGARRWAADMRHNLSRSGIESDVNRYRRNVSKLEAQAHEHRITAEALVARIAELRQERRGELERAGLWTGLRIASIPLLVMLALRLLRFLTGHMRRKAAEAGDDELTDRRRRLETLTNVIGTSVTVLVWIIAIIYVLAALGLDVTPIIASASVLGLAVAFGAQALIKDYFSGFFILLENQYTVGDVVDLGGANGTVEHISLRVTVVRDLNGVVHYVPNGLISRVSNKTKGWSRVVMEVRVAYDQDLDHITSLVEEVLSEVQHDPAWSATILEAPQVLGVQSFGESALDLRLLVKTQPGKQWALSRELRKRIKARFDREGIRIPVPQRVVHHVNTGPQAG